MALATGGFIISKLALTQILHLLPDQPQLLAETFFKRQEEGHPLGLGWNKIEFHRDFCRVAGLIQASRMVEALTPLGRLLARYDPDLSDLNTWWFIHANLAANPSSNVYYTLFARFPAQALSRDEVIKEMVSLLAERTAEATIKKDTSAILTWFEGPPFANLGTLVTDGRRWVRRRPNPLPDPAVIAYSALYLHHLEGGRFSSRRLSDLLNGPGKLVTIFALPEERLKLLLRQAVPNLKAGSVSISETAGIDTIYFGEGEAWQIAEQYYFNRAEVARRAS